TSSCSPATVSFLSNWEQHQGMPKSSIQQPSFPGSPPSPHRLAIARKQYSLPGTRASLVCRSSGCPGDSAELLKLVFEGDGERECAQAVPAKPEQQPVQAAPLCAGREVTGTYGVMTNPPPTRHIVNRAAASQLQQRLSQSAGRHRHLRHQLPVQPSPFAQADVQAQIYILCPPLTRCADVAPTHLIATGTYPMRARATTELIYHMGTWCFTVEQWQSTAVSE
ncbi:hypothetical protein QJQ45_028953, partial [Haematococcus lacustris]